MVLIAGLASTEYTYLLPVILNKDKKINGPVPVFMVSLYLIMTMQNMLSFFNVASRAPKGSFNMSALNQSILSKDFIESHLRLTIPI